MTWSMLEGRLKQSILSEEEALEQMKSNGDLLTPLAEKMLKKYKKNRNKTIQKSRKQVDKFG